jgi:hypothetical protein
MKILGTGMDYAGNLLFPSTDEGVFAKALVGALQRNGQAVQALTRTTTEAFTFRGEVEREILDPGDPLRAGWSFLVNSTDPQREGFEKILEPLAVHRGMADPKAPLLYNSEPAEEWFNWLHDNYFALKLEGKKAPYYILIAGGPDQVPFRFQSILSTVANVGRVNLDTLDALRQYVEKLIRIETVADPLVDREVVLFAPDAGLPDPTYFSREYMAKPLVEHMRNEVGIAAHTMLGRDATKKNLQDALCVKKPALVYTASHGLGPKGEPLEVQKRYNGAICCQKTGQEVRIEDRLFMADDVPLDRPFLEGAIFFQFACFGYGTPAESDYAHWLDEVPRKYADTDFVAALPKRLLSHPRGPIAYIGHLDTAFLHGFADVEEPYVLERWHNRIAPFVEAINHLLGVQTSGLSMRGMNGIRYSLCNALISNTYDRQQRGKLQWNVSLEARFLDNWITRSDAQNYMVFGDPAAKLRIPAE